MPTFTSGGITTAGNVVSLDFTWEQPPALPFIVDESIAPIFETDIGSLGGGGWQAGPRLDVHIIETFTVDNVNNFGNSVTVTMTLKEVIPFSIDPARIRTLLAGFVRDQNGLETPAVTSTQITNSSAAAWLIYHFAHDSPPVKNEDGTYSGEVSGSSFIDGDILQIGWDSVRAGFGSNYTDSRSNWDAVTNPITVLVDKGGPLERTLSVVETIETDGFFDTFHGRFRLDGTHYAGETARVNCNTGVVQVLLDLNPTWRDGDGYRDGREIRLTDPQGLEGGELWSLSTGMAGTSLQSGVYGLLSGSSAVASAVGTDPDGDVKVYPQTAPQVIDSARIEMPYITFGRIGSSPDHHQLNASGFTRATIQVDAWGANSIEVETITQAVRNLMDGQHGEVWPSGLQVLSCMLEDYRDEYEAPTDASQVGVWRSSMDFTIWHRQSIPTHV